ncbi:MAG: multidrug transporter subunit MdtD [Burkholderiaceae bacterium]|jgi:EmrB/QacA subfamily drug resistance transporter|nr:multidrug transporter subunit MdtD [Burkholderiaceae bacterium]
MTAPAPSTPPPSPAHGRALLWLVAIGFFMQSLDGTIVNTALPGMAQALHESPLHMQMVVVAYALTMAVVIPATGWLADALGVKQVYLAAIVLFTAGSLGCAMSPSLSWLIAARVLQGVGGAMLLPVGRLAVLRVFPREQFLEAMSFMAIPGLVGPLIGPTLGGWLVQAISWHWIFLINLPIGVLGVIATLAAMPRLRSPAAGHFDASGYLMLAVAMVSASLALDGMGGLALKHVIVLVLLLLGLSMLTAYWLHALRSPAPLFPPRLFGIQSYRVGLLGNLFARIGSGAMPYMIPLLMQLGMGYSPARAGLLMLPMAIAGIFAKKIVTPVITRLGYRRVLLGNTVLLGALMASFALMAAAQPMWLRISQLVAFGAVNSLQFTAMNTVTLKSLDADGAAAGNSLFSMVQMLAMSMGVSVAAGLLTAAADWLHVSARAGGAQALPAFQLTLVILGLMTIGSAFIFWQIESDPVQIIERQRAPNGGAPDKTPQAAQAEK